MGSYEDDEYEYDYEAPEEDEFKNRDNTGLKALESEPNSEQAEMKKYAVMLILIVPLIQTLLAVCVYLIGAKLMKQQDNYDKKFQFIHDWQLGFVYLAVYMLCFMRGLLIINANGARAPARVDRPDQHVYKIMDKDGANKDAAFVMMVNTGLQGRFNRAQRGVFNTDESLPMLLVNTVLTGLVFGPVVCVVLLIVMYGRVTFAVKYKESTSSRSAGFLPAMIGEGIITGLLILCTLKGIFQPFFDGRF